MWRTSWIGFFGIFALENDFGVVAAPQGKLRHVSRETSERGRSIHIRDDSLSKQGSESLILTGMVSWDRTDVESFLTVIPQSNESYSGRRPSGLDRSSKQRSSAFTASATWSKTRAIQDVMR